VGAPAQIDVLAVERDARVESPEDPEQVGAHEQTGGREHEHVADRVVLFLVELAGLDDRVDFAEPVEAEADVLEQAGLVPVDELRSDDPGVGAEELGNEHSNSVPRRGDVVVAQQEEAVVAVDEAQHLVGDRTEPEVPGGGTDEGARDDGADAGDRLVEPRLVARRHQEQRAKVRVVLVGERLQRLVEPVAWLVHDHDGHDRRHELGVRLHDGTRLAARLRRERSPIVPDGSAHPVSPMSHPDPISALAFASTL
jgi:hypothetical protein